MSFLLPSGKSTSACRMSRRRRKANDSGDLAGRALGTDPIAREKALRGLTLMARQLREKSATVYYYIMIMMRVINREFIYRIVKEKHYFMDLPKEDLSP